MKVLVKQLLLALVFVGFGKAVSAIDAIGGVQIFSWKLGALVGWATFTVAAVVLVQVFGRVPGVPVMVRLAEVLYVLLALYCVHLGVCAAEGPRP